MSLPCIKIQRGMSLAQLATESPQAARIVEKNCPKFPKWTCFFGAVILGIGIYLLTQATHADFSATATYISDADTFFAAGLSVSIIGVAVLFGLLSDYYARRQAHNALINLSLNDTQLGLILALETGRKIVGITSDQQDIESITQRGKIDLERLKRQPREMMSSKEPSASEWILDHIEEESAKEITNSTRR